MGASRAARRPASPPERRLSRAQRTVEELAASSARQFGVEPLVRRFVRLNRLLVGWDNVEQSIEERPAHLRANSASSTSICTCRERVGGGCRPQESVASVTILEEEVKNVTRDRTEHTPHARRRTLRVPLTTMTDATCVGRCAVPSAPAPEAST
jgi:hypothetical protein